MFSSVDKPASKVTTTHGFDRPIEGMAMTLLCVVDARPAHNSIEWLYDDKPIAQSGNYTINDDGSRLELRHLATKHDGMYTCIASNTLGRGSSVSSYRMYVLREYILSL